MLPSVLVSQLQQGVEDFLRTTFPSTTPHFHGMLDRFFDREGSVFKGPYVNVQLPFQHSGHGADYFPEVPLEFPPYAHQARAFDRLGGEPRESALVATGTGSGKTEAFLWPILEHVRQHLGEPGIKAVLIYPMNALATDQAGRIAEAVHGTEALDGARVGLYVGDKEDDPHVSMGPDHVITSRESMRLDPPDVLLTNYKMLDYLLTRPSDARLWAKNEPETLQYLVVDELHTFDGAQGTDLACLIRRLKDRLGTPDGHLCCVGTSATLGGPDDFKKLRDYAEDVFGEAFEADAVIGEERRDADDFLRAVEATQIPGVDELETMRAEAYATPEAYVRSQVPLWFNTADIDVGTEAGRKQLGDRLRAHSMLHDLLEVLGGTPQPVRDLLDGLQSRVPELEDAPSPYQRAVLDSFLALLSWARADVETHAGEREEVAFVYTRVQLWLRELRRMVASVDSEPDLVFWDDLKEGQRDDHLPVAHCLECGAMGWLGIRHQNEKRFQATLKEIYEHYFDSRPSFSFAFPEASDGDIAAEGTRHQFCGHDLHLSDADADACEACGRSDRLIRVFVPNNRTTTQGNRQVGTNHCPHCSAPSSLTILGSRAASLTSVMISQLFASAHNEDKKLLTFSDSVQDAAHRAGFFEARTYRFNLRSAIQQYVERANSPLSLETLPKQVGEHYAEQMGEKAYVSTFIAPDMQWFREFEHLQRTGTFPGESTLVKDVSRRVSWEVWSEYGFRARIGRTLEKTGSSVAALDAERLDRAVADLTPILRNEVGDLREASSSDVERFIQGIVAHLKNQGAIFHPELRTYIERGGDGYVISGRHRPYMPNFGRRSRLPAFIAERGTNRFDPVLGPASRTGRSWMQAWAIKCYGDYDPMLESVLGPLYDETLRTLVSAGILGRRTNHHGKVWGVEPSALLVETDVAQLRCDECGHNASIARREQDAWEDTPCLRYQCAGSYAREATSSNYYRQLYREGDIERIIAREHTGLLEREDREALEREFKKGEKPWGTNLISCTPTLEMGVDIGKLSTVILCSVPPGPSNFVQRIGRGGRRSGNAVDVTVANGQPHDLYFFEDPTEMIAGAIDPPGVFLGAVAVLYRQYVAYCFDRWVATGVPEEAVPSKLSSMLRSLGEEDTFPGTWLSYVEGHEEELFQGFVDLFGSVLDEDRVDALRRIVGQGGGLRYRVLEQLEEIKNRRDDLHRRSRRLYRSLRDLEEGPTRGAQQDKIDEMRREKRALQKIYKRIGDTNTYNFFTDAGLLPNYAFPESGVTLRSVLYRTGEDGGDVWDEEYVRPAPHAIRELAPGSTFYAGGRRVTVDQIDLSGDETLETWRLCDRCGHMERVVDDETTRDSCPHCGSPHWGDRGQERTLVRHGEVAATTADRRSRIDDAGEGREREFFDTGFFVEVNGQEIEEAYRIDNRELPFGFEFIRQATFREVNFGKPGVPPLMTVGGEDVHGQGFRTCPSCGRVAIGNDPIDHTRSCRAESQNGEEAAPENLFLYREIRSEAVRILLPETSFAGTPERVQSLKAAIQLGLEEEFEGSVAHLRTVIQEQPGDREIARRRYLVLYDTVPGGTGYLAELLRQKEKFMNVLDRALQVLKTCGCREDEDKDGCYQCLYAYRNAYDMPHTSRQVAIDLLQQILDHRDELVEIDTVDDISVTGVIESELEARFIQRLRDLEVEPSHLERKIVRGRPGYTLRIGDHRYDIEPQVEVGPSDGVLRSCSIDFLIHPIEANLRPIAVFLDGLQYHRNRIGRDCVQRRALRASGEYYVWSLTWRDVVESGNGHPGARNYLNERDDRFVQLLTAMGEGQSRTLRERLTENSLSWLVELLQHPESDSWSKIALAQALLLATRRDDKAQWVEWARRCLPDDLAEVLQEEAGREQAFVGLQDAGPDGADDPLTVWAVTTAEGLQGVGSDVQRALRSVTLALHLDDTAEDVPDDFEAAWNGFLRLYNLYQFLPESYPVTADGEAFAAYHELLGTGVPGTDKDRLPVDERGDGSTDEEWAMIFEYALPETAELLRELRRAGVPAPQSPYELQRDGTIVADAELGWPASSVAVLLPEQSDHRTMFEEEGWEVFTLREAQERPDELIAAFQSSSADPPDAPPTV